GTAVTGRVDLHPIPPEPGRPHLQRLVWLLKTLPVLQPVMLFVEWRRHHRRILDAADHSSTDNIGTGLRIAIVNGVDLPTRSALRQMKQCNLGTGEPGDHAGIGHQILPMAQRVPMGDWVVRFDAECLCLGHQSASSVTGMSVSSVARAGRRWPRSLTKWMSGSPRPSLTKVRKRLSFSGSLMALVHSHS